MTRDFDPVAEFPIQQSEFGEGKIEFKILIYLYIDIMIQRLIPCSQNFYINRVWPSLIEVREEVRMWQYYFVLMSVLISL